MMKPEDEQGFIKFEKIKKIIHRSIFTMIPDADKEQVMKNASVVIFPAGIVINPELSIDCLYLLLEGRLDKIDQETGALMESILIGRSLEFDTLIEGRKQWRHEWRTSSSVELLVIPFLELRNILRKTDSYLYLERIVQKVEFHKIKNDLRFLGLSQEKIQNIILNFHEIVDPINLKTNSIIVVSQGSMVASYEHEGKVFELKKFSVSDPIFYLIDPSFQYHFSNDFQGWCIDAVSFNEKSANPGMSDSFNVLAQKVYDIKASLVNKTEFEETLDESPLEEDDGLQVSDFYQDQAISSRIKIGKPVHFMQYDQMDCGAACMAMISHYYSKKINISTWRSIIYVTREGASMLAVKNGAHQMGYQAIGVMSGLKALTKMRTPFIALMAYHYVVVYKIDEQEVCIADPAKGLLTLSLEEFSKDFSKNCLLIKPTERILDFPESTPAFKKYFFLFKDLASDFFVVAAFSVVLFLIALAPALFNQFVFDQVLKTGNIKLLNRVGCCVLLLISFLASSKFIRTLMLSRMTSELGVKLSALFFRHTVKLPFSYFAVRNVGDITTRVQELDKIRNFMSHEMIDIFINAMSVILFAAVFYFYHIKFFYMAIGFTLAIFIIMMPLFKIMVKLNQLMFHSIGKNHSIAFEQFRGLKTIQALAATLQARWKWEESYDEILKIRDQFNQYLLRLVSTNSTVQQVITLSFLFLAIQLFMKGQITLGQVVAISGLSSSLITPVLALVQATHQVTNVRVSFEKIDEIVTSPIEKISYVSSPRVKNEEIHFKEVWFQYGNDLSPWVLKGVNFSIQPGEKIALVGPSGSGKSTLAYMVNLIYSPTKGAVLLGDTQNTKIDLSVLRSRVSMILQDNAIFQGTVLHNIAFGDEFPNLEIAVRAAKIAEAHEFISALPSGYSTPLADGKKDLSGGQKQRISIARALYHTPEILILDEATSALDSITEKKVLQNLRKELKNTTCITVAHRLNTIIDSDRILVLDHGKLVEQGKHDELMKRQGLYFEMFRKQMHH